MLRTVNQKDPFYKNILLKILFNCIQFSKTDWISLCRFPGNVFQKWFVMSSFLWLKQTDFYIAKEGLELLASKFLTWGFNHYTELALIFLTFKNYNLFSFSQTKLQMHITKDNCALGLWWEFWLLQETTNRQLLEMLQEEIELLKQLEASSNCY